MQEFANGHVQTLSSESLSALLLALGLVDQESHIEHTVLPSYQDKRTSTPFSRNDLSPCLDERQAFSREYLAGFESYSELEEDSDYETLPSRPGSSLESFEITTSPTSPPLVLPQRDNHTPFEQLHQTKVTGYSASMDLVHIKAAHNASIIMLRVPRHITLQELKHRLYDKFVNQEQVLLSNSFSVVHALPPSFLSHSDRKRVPFAECTEMRFVDRESDWRKIIVNHQGSKITLRVLDTPL